MEYRKTETTRGGGTAFPTEARLPRIGQSMPQVRRYSIYDVIVGIRRSANGHLSL